MPAAVRARLAQYRRDGQPGIGSPPGPVSTHPAAIAASSSPAQAAARSGAHGHDGLGQRRAACRSRCRRRRCLRRAAWIPTPHRNKLAAPPWPPTRWAARDRPDANRGGRSSPVGRHGGRTRQASVIEDSDEALGQEALPRGGGGGIGEGASPRPAPFPLHQPRLRCVKSPRPLPQNRNRRPPCHWKTKELDTN